MYCTSCGMQLPPGAVSCPNCGQAVRRFAAAPTAVIPNYLISSILVTLCCCMPFGIVALVFSAQVNSKLAAGDVAGAQAASNSAKTWNLVAFLAGLLTFGSGALITFMKR